MSSAKLNNQKAKNIRIRLGVESSIHRFFGGLDFTHVRTPLLVRSPGMEPHIRPLELQRPEGAERVFLPTSPEFAMKKLMAQGYEKIFQICSAFRDEPKSPEHLPEFTMLEWYRAQATYDSIMKDSENLIEFVATQVVGKAEISWRGVTVNLKTPWPRISVESLYSELGVNLRESPEVPELEEACRRFAIPTNSSDSWDDLFFKLWLNKAEQLLPKDRPVIVFRYPPSQAALSVIETDSDQSRWARRFEIFIGGLELANAFEELTDPVEQRHRFEKDMRLRSKVYGESFPVSPIDEDFIRAVGQMPPSSGIAMGVDRLVMLMADESDISNTVLLEPFLSDKRPN